MKVSSILLAVVVIAVVGSTARAETIQFGAVTTFTGPAGIGFTDSFLYAVNVGGEQHTVGSTIFTDGSFTTDVTITTGHVCNDWQVKPEYGSDDASNELESVMHDIISGGGSGTIDAKVIVGQQYQLQLLFSENSYGNPGHRFFDVSVEGAQAIDEFDVGANMGDPVLPVDEGVRDSAPTTGVLYTYNFTATDDQLNITFSPGSSGDINYIANAFTLKVVPEPSTFALAAIGLLGLLGWGRRRRQR